MPGCSVFCGALLLSTFLFSITAKAQVPTEEIAPLPTELSPGRMAAMRLLFPKPPTTMTATPWRPRRFFVYSLRHPLTPRDVAVRESVRALGTDKHRFVHCELKDQTVVTGAITSIGAEHFFVETGILGSGRPIPYRELSTAPQPVAAVGTHLKNGLEWTGFVAIGIALIPFFLILGMTGVMQD